MCFTGVGVTVARMIVYMFSPLSTVHLNAKCVFLRAKVMDPKRARYLIGSR